ncbi:DUF4242 domain-containing protein [Caldimonas tepidiphila]|uniref:DUF4242 domain-containing protein n=1 Tax=Caldimonas tepidiphila TaxID=2315841 RepID=UPI000E5BF9D0|nr:DUF4242 domain-containing protein [Caldimonas tepidiphila]
MAVYMVERDLPGISIGELAAAQKAAIEKVREFNAEGRDVRYMRSIFVSGESRCMCLFEAGSADTVRAVNEAAQLPFTGIKEAMDLPPQSS